MLSYPPLYHHSKPRWLQALLTEKFFNACLIHEEDRKNEKNYYCLDCCDSICQYCLPSHKSHNHRLLQIRRYMYHYVIRLDDIAKLMDCSSVQSYTNNGAKVVFLNQRPQPSPQCQPQTQTQPQARQYRSSGNICRTCNKTLQEPYIYCCLFCKIDFILKTEGGLSNYLRECNFLPLPDDALMTPDTVLDLELAVSSRTSSDSAGSSGMPACTAVSPLDLAVRKKRTTSCTAGGLPAPELQAPEAIARPELAGGMQSPAVEAPPRRVHPRKRRNPRRAPMS